MSIDTVCAGLAEALDGLTVTSGSATYTLKGYDPPPPKLDTANLPAAYVFTGAAADEWDADYGAETRQYEIHVAVLPIGQSTPAERETRCRPWLAAARDALAGQPTLNDTAGVRRLTVTGDTGIVALSEYSEVMLGFALRVAVEETINRTYTTGE